MDSKLVDDIVAQLAPGLRAGLGITAYFERSHEAPAREALIELVREARAEQAGAFRWKADPKRGTFHPIDYRRIADPELRLARLTGDVAEWQRLAAGDDAMEASLPTLIVATRAQWEQAKGMLGELHYEFPASEDGAERLERWMRRIVAVLPVVHAHAGWRLALPVRTDAARTRGAQVLAVARALPGLDLDGPTIAHHLLRDRIKGPAWLLFLRDELVQAAGGLEAMRARAGGEVEIERLGGGQLLRAGPAPEPGADGVAPRALVAMARAVDPIRLRDHPQLYDAAPGSFNHDETVAWLERFAARA
ncbi:type VI immunity family protein [Sorangium sp. So ce341]|uniref:type VI immunity family protein n=1 Tax=Sorangium sp. So ce341 TaxID=3133302 RepID=UPI003F62358D